MFPGCFSLALAILPAAPVNEGGTYVVDFFQNPGFDFDNIEDAVNSVPSGSILLMRSGSSANGDLIIDGKALTILAESAADIDLGVERVFVRNLASDQAFRSRGVDFENLTLENNAGSIWIEDAELEGGLSEGGLVVRSSGSVTLRDVDIPPAVSYFAAAFTGLRILEGSSVAAFGCLIEGASASDAYGYGCSASSGVFVDDGSVFYAADSVITGRACSATFAQNSAPAIRADNESSLVLRNVVLEPGVLDGVPAPEVIALGNSSLIELSDFPRSVSTVPLSLSGDTVEFVVRGEPLEQITLHLSESALGQMDPSGTSAIALGSPFLASIPLTLDATGTGSLTRSFPLTTGQPSLTIHAQSEHAGQSPSVFGAPTSYSVLIGNCGSRCQPSANVNAGSPANPIALGAPAGGPGLGQVWQAQIDHTSFAPSASLDVVAIGFSPANVSTPNGTLLINLGGIFLQSGTPGSVIATPIPADCALSCLQLYAQGVSIQGTDLLLTNGLDLTLGTP